MWNIKLFSFKIKLGAPAIAHRFNNLYSEIQSYMYMYIFPNIIKVSTSPARKTIQLHVRQHLAYQLFCLLCWRELKIFSIYKLLKSFKRLCLFCFSVEDNLLLPKDRIGDSWLINLMLSLLSLWDRLVFLKRLFCFLYVPLSLTWNIGMHKS